MCISAAELIEQMYNYDLELSSIVLVGRLVVVSYRSYLSRGNAKMMRSWSVHD